MSKRIFGALMAATLGLVFGCGQDDTVITDPANLPKLTAEDIKKFEAEDLRVQEEEGGAGRVFVGNKSRTKGKVAMKPTR